MREGMQKVVSTDDTIVAISTPLGRSGIGVVRISGMAAADVGRRLFTAGSALGHRRAIVGEWLDHGEVVDEVVVTLFCKPHTYTGEDVLEISAHGNPLVLKRILETIQSLGVRIAGPGEFTLRAVIHGKMDLIQAEAVRDFIDAQTDEQARTALGQIEGALSKRLKPIKEDLVDAIAHLEAGIDFADDDVEPPDSVAIAARVSAVRGRLEELQATYAYGKLLNTGIRVVIAGKPNVGKSSLFNRLVATERAIVTDIPGTTRDVIAETTNLDGIPLKFFDTAGLRETPDRVEQIGVTRALETLTEAELALLVVDGSEGVAAEDSAIAARLQGVPHFVIVNKCDLSISGRTSVDDAPHVYMSASTGEGVNLLLDSIREFLTNKRVESGMGESMLTNARQNDAVIRSIAALSRGENALTSGTPHEMAALELYAALSALNELTGETATEDILGRIFSTFCIGK
jgi:tRNA modification GTPase